MRGIVTKGGSTVATMAASSQPGLKYRRKKLRMDETVEQIGLNVSNSLLQSRAQKERMGQIEQQSYKLNFRGLAKAPTKAGGTANGAAATDN
jgi:hypothetical protein